MKNRFSSIALLTIEPLLRAACRHPFVVELVDGILSPEQFLYYMRQSDLRLADRARALALAGAKMRAADDLAQMLSFAGRVLTAEQALHKGFSKNCPLPPGEGKGPACFACTAHLLERAALGSPGEAVAALLPGFWIDREVGSHVRKLADDDNPWFAWIAYYSGDDYAKDVDRAVDLADRLACEAGEEERQRMMNDFIAAARHACLFWDEAYHLRGWPA